MHARLPRSILSGLVAGLCTLATVAIGPDPAGATAPCPPQLDGTWIGSWTSTTGLYSGTDQGTINFHGTTFDGLLTFITGTSAISNNTPFAGTINCDTLMSNVNNIAATQTLSPDGTELSGSYNYAAGADVGTLHAALAQTAITSPGALLETDPGGVAGATAAQPLQVGVSSPVPGNLAIAEATSNGGVAAGYQLFNKIVQIQAPVATAGNPLHFSFTLDASMTGGAPAATIAIFRNGLVVTDCTGPAGVASPDPCVAARTDVGNGDSSMGILTSAASVWSFGSAKTASVGSASAPEGDTGSPRTIRFPVVLSTPSSTPVAVSYSVVADGSASTPADLVVKTGAITFKPSIALALTGTSAQIAVRITPDTVPESDETFHVRLTGVTGGYGLASANAVGTILDDDGGPGFTIGVGDVSITEGDTTRTVTASNRAQVTLALSTPWTGLTPGQVVVTTTFGSATGTDARIMVSRIVKFTSGQFQKTIAIPIFADTLPELNETLTVTVSAPSGYTQGHATGTFVIANDD